MVQNRSEMKLQVAAFPGDWDAQHGSRLTKPMAQ